MNEWDEVFYIGMRDKSENEWMGSFAGAKEAGRIVDGEESEEVGVEWNRGKIGRKKGL